MQGWYRWTFQEVEEIRMVASPSICAEESHFGSSNCAHLVEPTDFLDILEAALPTDIELTGGDGSFF